MELASKLALVDEPTRQDERAAQAGDLERAAADLRARVRADRLDEDVLGLLASLGDPAACLATSREPPHPAAWASVHTPELRALARELWRAGFDVALSAVRACAGLARQRWAQAREPALVDAVLAELDALARGEPPAWASWGRLGELYGFAAGASDPSPNTTADYLANCFLVPIAEGLDEEAGVSYVEWTASDELVTPFAAPFSSPDERAEQAGVVVLSTALFVRAFDTPLEAALLAVLGHCARAELGASAVVEEVRRAVAQLVFAED